VGRLLREAEKEVGRLERHRDRITDALTGTADHREMARLGDELNAAQTELDRAEERWLELAERSESAR
jgi:ATP-binding cassette subfamily F protein uup